MNSLPLWISSIAFAAVTLASLRFIEETAFSILALVLGLVHVFTAILRTPRDWRQIFLSQTLVVLASVGAVLLHVVHFVGLPPSSFPKTLWSFLRAVVTSGSTYSYFALNLLIILIVVAGLLGMARLFRLRRQIDLDFAIAVAYVASAANIIFSYSLSRPLYHVSGEPEAAPIFFAAGVFGIETALYVHFLALGGLLLRSRIAIQHKDAVDE